MSQTAALQEHIEKLKEVVERRDLALRLAKNHDFRKLILEELFVNETARYVHTSANLALSEAERKDALEVAQAFGHVKMWLSIVGKMGDQAEREIHDAEEALAELRAEEDADPLTGEA